MPTLGAEIRSARCEAKKSLRAFANELGISPASLSLIERDHHVPSRELIVRAAEILGTDSNHWCALVNTITPNAEASLVALARKNPIYFRRLVRRWRTPDG